VGLLGTGLSVVLMAVALVTLIVTVVRLARRRVWTAGTRQARPMSNQSADRRPGPGR
jgi:hypothetical protein